MLAQISLYTQELLSTVYMEKIVEKDIWIMMH